MNVIEQQPEARSRGMLLHCGAKIVNREHLYGVTTPRGTNTWYPLSHGTVLDAVETQLKSNGFTVAAETHALSHEGARYFGVLSVSLPHRENTETSWVVGLRNSHDKTYPAGLVAGTRVFVCDNLSFCGEVKIARKHTRYAYRDLRHLTARAVGQLGEKFQHQDLRIATYRGKSLTDKSAHDVVIRAVDCRAITTTQVPSVLKEWREPTYPDFQPRTAWSLFNAFTENYKTIEPTTALHRSQALHGLFDQLVGLPFHAGVN